MNVDGDGMNRVLRLERVGIYHAPAGRNPRPFRIPEGTELIEILTGGTLFFPVDGVERTFHRGAVFWHLAGEETISRTSPRDPYRCFVASFRVAERRRVLPRITCWEEPQTLEELIEEALRRFHDETVDPRYLGQYLYSRIFWEAYGYTRRQTTAALPEPVLRALALLRERLDPGVSVAELARVARVSEPNLHVLFRQHLQTTPHQYLLNCRLRRARRRLAGSECSIKALAEECGFRHLESFYRAFRRHCGMTPGEYRRRQQSGGRPPESWL